MQDFEHKNAKISLVSTNEFQYKTNIMTREELLNMPECWVAQIQTEIYRCADRYMEEHHMKMILIFLWN